MFTSEKDMEKLREYLRKEKNWYNYEKTVGEIKGQEQNIIIFREKIL